jgi:hypothetical protein
MPGWRSPGVFYSGGDDDGRGGLPDRRAKPAIEVARSKKSCILDTLVTSRKPGRLKHHRCRWCALAIAEVIEEAAVKEAIETLAVAGLLEEKYLKPAIEAEAAQADEEKEIFAEMEQ